MERIKSNDLDRNGPSSREHLTVSTDQFPKLGREGFFHSPKQPSRPLLKLKNQMMNLNLPVLYDETLPSFPCGLNKKPLTPHGFKDATTDPKEFIRLGHLKQGDSFLYGVPTGELTGFDVLDIDTDGLEWKNKQNLNLTRTHLTRNSGFHLLFKHCHGLKNSASKIAQGVDVRADGGYIIWWPNHGLNVLNPNTILFWPNWLVDLLINEPKPSLFSSMVTPKQPGHHRPGLQNKNWFTFKECTELLSPDSDDDEVIGEIYMQLLAEGRHGVTMIGSILSVKRFSRESRYALQAAAKTIFRIGNASIGTRNSTLNAESYALGRIMARGWISPNNLIRALWRGAIQCNLVNDDGLFQTVNTIVSGLIAGLENPYPDLDTDKGQRS